MKRHGGVEEALERMTADKKERKASNPGVHHGKLVVEAQSKRLSKVEGKRLDSQWFGVRI